MAEVTVPLSTPIITHGGETKSLTIREPKYAQFRKHGEPFKARMKDGSVVFDFNDKAIGGFLSECTGIDPILFDEVTAKDYLAARMALVNLIMGVGGENPTEK